MCKSAKISRPAVMVAFILVEKLENYIQQTQALYTVGELVTRPIFVTLIVIAIGVLLYSIFKPNRGLAYH